MAYQLTVSQPWLECQSCELAQWRTNVVLGIGDDDADIVFIGQNPGVYEDESGQPWSGRAGDIFETFLGKFSLSFDSVFVDNAIGCAPFEPDPKRDGRLVLTKPKDEHLRACRPRIQDAIYAVDPYVVVAMGEVAFKTLTGASGKIHKLRQHVRLIKVPGIMKYVTYPLITTYNPAALINQEGKPIDEFGAAYKPGQHKRPGSLWDRFFRDLDFIYGLVETLKIQHRRKR